MNHFNSKNVVASSVLMLSLLWLQPSPLLADSSKLQPYQASYRVEINNNYVANAKLSLKQQNSLWHWQLKLKPVGIYRWLTNKAPLSQTDFKLQDQQLKIQSSVNATSGKNTASDAARTYFDWQSKQLHYQKSKRSRSLPIVEEIYNYDTIYWLAARMATQQLASAEVDFFYKGKLGRSTLRYEGETSIQIDGKMYPVKHYSHSQTLSSSRFDYYFDDERFIPLKIVKTKKKKSTVMIRFAVSQAIASNS